MTAAAAPGAVATATSVHPINGPWSLGTSRRFWEGFAPSALPVHSDDESLHAVFLCDSDWQRVEADISQQGATVRVAVSGSGDLDAATAQVLRFLSLDIDATTWPDAGVRDEVIASAQRALPGFRPCGFYSPYEAAVWSVLSQRVRMTQAAAIATRLIEQYGDRGAFPTPVVLRSLDLGLPGRKGEYVRAVADAALDGMLSGAHLRSLTADAALAQVQTITGIGPFAAELIVIRGANSPDVLPRSEKRLNDEITRLYGDTGTVESITDEWRPFRSWAAVHLRALREYRQSAGA